MQKQKISIELIGGIGNQLFCYFAGLYISDKTSSRVKFIHNALPKNHPQFNSQIGDLNLPTGIKASTFNFFPATIFVKILDSISFRVPVIKKLKNNGIYLDQRVGVINESREIQNKIDRRIFKKSLVLKGHYQDIAYYSEYMKNSKIMPIHPKNPSNEYRQLINSKLLENLTVIHIRRGDFEHFKSEIGVLSTEYYRLAIIELLEREKQIEIVVVSDEPEKAKIIFPRNFSFIPTSYTRNFNLKNPAELLLAMSFAKNLIISNSTFSLWSAIFSLNTKNVLYPQPFNLNLPMKVSGFPSSWIPLPAVFEK
jgi:hypothetical protein